MKPTESALKSDPFTGRPWFAAALFFLLLGVSVWVMTRAWGASLLDRFQFRQTQTALTSYWMQRDGFHLAYLTPVFGPPWSIPMEFPLYEWLVARLASGTGLSLVSAARLIGIFFFLSALPAIYGLATLVERDARRRLLVPAVVLTAPVCLFYSRAFVIESCAAAFSVWFLYAHLRSLRDGDWRWTAIATATGILGALVKITTFALFGLPAAAYTLYLLWANRQIRAAGRPSPGALRLIVASAIPAGSSAAAILWWVSFSDHIKASNPFADILTSGHLREWNYGTLSQRLDPVVWSFVGRQLMLGIFPWTNLLLLAAGCAFISVAYRKAALFCSVGFLIGPLLFTNLYAIHEYYYYPSAFFAAAGGGIILAGLMETNRLRPLFKAGIVLLFVVLQAQNFYAGYASTLRDLPAPPPPLMDVIHRATADDEVVLVYGWDWNTLIPYYTERRALLVPLSKEDDASALLKIVGQLKPGQVSALVMQGPHKQDQNFIKWRTSLLNLSAKPVATSPDGDLYLPPAAIASLEGKLAGHSHPGVQFDFVRPPEPVDPRLHYQKVDPATYAALTSPPPFAVFNPWTVEVAPLDGQPVIFANAPSEVHFRAPPGATHIEATFGLNDGAYKTATPTDGIDVIIFERLPSGGRRVLFQRYLDPLKRPEDRGPQSVSLDAIGQVTGPLVFALYPGPADNMTCDWSYWKKIKIY